MWRNQSGITLRSRHETSKRGRESGEADGRSVAGTAARGSRLPNTVGSGSYRPFHFVPREPMGKIRYSHFATKNGLGGVRNSHRVPNFLTEEFYFQHLKFEAWVHHQVATDGGPLGTQVSLGRDEDVGGSHCFKVTRKEVVCPGRELSSGPGDRRLRKPDNPGLRAARGEDDGWSGTETVARAGASCGWWSV